MVTRRRAQDDTPALGSSNNNSNHHNTEPPSATLPIPETQAGPSTEPQAAQNEPNVPITVHDTPTPTQEPTDPRPLLPPSIRDELRAAQARLNDLEAQADLLRIRKRIAQLEENPLGEEPPKRQRTDDADSSSRRRGPKIESIPVFTGKDISEWQNFDASVRIAFRMDPAAFSWEDQKIAFTLQYLDTTHRHLWLQYEQQLGDTETNWADMMTWLLDQIRSPQDRQCHVIGQWCRYTQREGQSTNDVATQLQLLENQFDEKHKLSADQSRIFLFGKLHPRIREALMTFGDLPSTRTGLMQRASLLEEGLRREKRMCALGDRPNRIQHDPTKMTGKTRPNDEDHDRNAKCAYCGKPGHREDQCYTKKNAEKRAPGVNTEETKNY